MENSQLLIPLFAISFLTSVSSASLPPYWDSVKQIETVLKSAGLDEKLSGPIATLRNRGYLTYVVRSAFCTATVRLQALPTRNPGPTDYEVKAVDQVTCQKVPDHSKL